jgi:hypothetical protein
MAKKIGKHLQFYIDCNEAKRMPYDGLCGCAWRDLVDGDLVELFMPDHDYLWKYWANQDVIDRFNDFNSLRQTIVLFMATINGEL